ncbi:MAG: flagellar hook protein FlgE [Steroidobacteraceae bacterium]|nr:flagellar hook protein FlgE [Pseudomonadota bacterium]MBP6106612.1 flagellar hook protein FlgE [Steroidobacteraceae bacterium]MBP7014355.1 flagellar hook protein FlgE [Steroidobacteraceae bacterium]
MPFRIALSGLNAASADLSVTANNVANVSTAGFKSSRAQFADVFSIGAQGIGNGVRIASVNQQFEQGGIDFTDNALDLAISGQGFFTLSDNGSLVYTRAGAFGVDREGFVVNSKNQRLQIYPPTGTGTFNTGSLTDLRLTTTDSAPQATGLVEMTVNLPAGAALPTNPVFDPLDPSSFTQSTSMTVYDSLGSAHTSTYYFVKGAVPGAWDVHTYIDGNAVGGANALSYTSAGLLSAPAGGLITLPAYDPANGAAPMNLTVDLGDSTQFGGPFGVNALTQDGYAAGRLASIDINPEGVVFARFTNGRSTELGKVVLSNFPNPQGLRQLGDSNWSESFSSGDAIRGEAGSASFGLLQAGALEASNVDLTEELVNMITAQRNFQANAQMISTADSVTQTIINIR